VVAFHASRPGHDVPADLVRVNHAIGTNHEVVTEQYRNVIARVIERCYGCLARLISPVTERERRYGQSGQRSFVAVVSGESTHAHPRLLSPNTALHAISMGAKRH
jgi:hypothetical protein